MPRTRSVAESPVAQDTWWRESVMIDHLSVVEDWSRRTFGDEFARFLGPADEASNAPGGEEFVEPVSASR